LLPITEDGRTGCHRFDPGGVGHVAAVSTLLAARAQTDPNNSQVLTALIVVAYFARAETVAALLAAGKDAATASAGTALGFTQRKGHLRCVAMLS
jgi:hypothetical protein